MRKSFYKSLLNSPFLCSRVRLAINKKHNYFSLPDHQIAKNFILVFDFYESQTYTAEIFYMGI